MSELLRATIALQDDSIHMLEAENKRLTAHCAGLENADKVRRQRIEQLEGAIAKALPVAAELDCMLASHAKSKRAYGWMQDKAEYIRAALKGDT